MHRPLIYAILMLIGVASIAADAPPAATGPASVSTTAPTTAIEAYAAAHRLAAVPSPANSLAVLSYEPPYSAEWMNVSEKAWQANASGRATLHAARGLPRGQWTNTENEPLSELVHCRYLANTLSDGAAYAVTQGRSDEAIDLLDDLAAMNDVICGQPGTPGAGIRLLVSVGIDALWGTRVICVAPSLRLLDRDHASDAAVDGGVRPTRVRATIAALLRQQPGQAAVDAAIGGHPIDPKSLLANNLPRAIEAINRSNAECTMAAMSLACQLYRLEQGVWPEAAADLVPAYLPVLPIDPWGDGRETFGYRVVPGGLPNGDDRPLVFCRCTSKNGLAVPAKGPLYGYYQTTGLGGENARLELGQFRDVAAWPAQ